LLTSTSFILFQPNIDSHTGLVQVAGVEFTIGLLQLTSTSCIPFHHKTDSHVGLVPLFNSGFHQIVGLFVDGV
jgi:hypothetical protein